MKDSSSGLSLPRATMVVGVLCMLLSLWANPVVLGRWVPSPPAHDVYFFIGAFVIFAGSRFLQMARRNGDAGSP